MQFVFCILFFKQFHAFDVHSFIISNIQPLRGSGGRGEQVVNAQNYVFYFESDIAKVFPFRPTCSSYDSERKKKSKKGAKKDQKWK
jgi:hypothetical protein